MKPIHLPIRHIRQRNPGECLTACAKMALDFLGVSVTYDHLVKLLKIESFGAVFSKVRELEQVGVQVIYKRGTLEELHDHLSNNRPCIALVWTGELPYWQSSTFHAVVVAGLDDQSVYLNDPDFPDAPVQVSHGDFGLAWLERDELYAALMKRG